MSNTKERPALFNGAMVRAIREDRKTVTRRPVKATKAHADSFMMLDHGKGWWPYNAFGDFTSDHEGMEYPITCPYGKPGDLLWVRETWADVNLQGAPGLAYRADGDVRDLMEDKSFLDDRGAFNYDDARTKPYQFSCWSEDLIAGIEGRWHPSIHMPRWASRILLEITDVRVERLQDITEEQALAEGIKKHSDGGYHIEDGKYYSDSPIESFAGLWSSVGGDWDANPWVWCVSFKRVTP